MALQLVLGATASTLSPPRARVAPRHAPACANAADSSGSGSGVIWPSAPAENIELAETYYRAFEVLARDADFAADVWARKPLLVAEPIAGVAGSFTLDDVREAVDSDFLEAGLGVPTTEGGWKMAPVSQPRGSSYEDAKLRYVDVAAGIERGTVVFNSAGAHVPKLGAICLAALRAFGLPNCLNMYLTGPSVKQSAPPHTDKQDVLVLQMSGAKHWRVYEPPPPSRRPGSDPLARGKGDDKLSLSELGEPLLEAVLRPGQLLYVPAGFPHTTGTVDPHDGSHVLRLARAGEELTALTRLKRRWIRIACLRPARGVGWADSGHRYTHLGAQLLLVETGRARPRLAA